MQLSLVWFMPRRTGGDLDMANPRQGGLDPPRDIALRNLDVVAVEHQFQIGMTEIPDHVERLTGRPQHVSRLVALIDGLYQNGNTLGTSQARRMVEIGPKSHRAIVRISDPRHAVNGRGADGFSVIQRFLKGLSEFIFAAAKAGKSEIAWPVSDRRVDAENRKSCLCEHLPDRAGRRLIGPVHLYRAKSPSVGRPDALNERKLGKEKSDVRRKLHIAAFRRDEFGGIMIM